MDTTKITGTISIQNGGIVTNYTEQEFFNDLLNVAFWWFVIGFCAGIAVYYFFGTKQKT